MEDVPGAIIIEGHVQGLSNTRSLGECGIPVYVIDKSICIARYSKYCNKFFICPDFNSEEFVSFLIDLVQQENLKNWVLIPSNDHAVNSISKHKSELEAYYKVITPGIDIIEYIYDKANLLGLSKKCNVPIPKTQYFITENDFLSEDISFPVITKGRKGLSFFRSFGKKAFLANSAIELRLQLKQIAEKISINDTFTQELIPYNGTNNTISFTAFCINGEIKTHWIGEKLREHPVRFGTATFARSIICDKLLAPSQQLMNKLNYTGVCEIEYLLDPRDNEFKLIEINARTWLWVGLAKACGINFAKIIYDYTNDKEIIFPESYSVDISWVNYFTDTTFVLIALLKRKLKLKDYFKSLQGVKTNAIFSRKDMMPGFMFFLLFIYISFKRRQ